MKTIWKLLDTGIKPIITYACETWNPGKGECKEINKILDNIIKRILKTPVSTPREAIYLETRITDVEHTMNRNRILMLHRLWENPNDLIKKFLQNSHRQSWAAETKLIMKEYTDTDILQLNSHAAKRIINSSTKAKCTENMVLEGIFKSKVEFLLQNINLYNKETPPYLNELCRNDASIIFKARTRMINVKNNYKTKYKGNMKCRGCGLTDESQKHVLEECTELHRNDSSKVPNEQLFNDSIDTEKLKEMAKKLHIIEEIINTER